MEHFKAILGNGVAWLGVFASVVQQLLPIFQLVAVLLASAASVATYRYFRNKAKKE